MLRARLARTSAAVNLTRVYRLGAAAIATALVIAGTPLQPASADPIAMTGRIALYGAGYAGAGEVQVHYRPYGADADAGVVPTDAEGRFAVPGTQMYKLYYEYVGTGGYVSHWNDQGAYDTKPRSTGYSGNVFATLYKPSTISGSIMLEPLIVPDPADLLVRERHYVDGVWSDYSAGAPVAADGTYAFTGMKQGDYQLRVDYTGPSTDHPHTWYVPGGAPTDGNLVNSFTLLNGASNVNAYIPRYEPLSGHISLGTAGVSAGAGDVTVRIGKRSTNYVFQPSGVEVSTDASGDYVIPKLLPGQYDIQFVYSGAGYYTSLTEEWSILLGYNPVVMNKTIHDGVTLSGRVTLGDERVVGAGVEVTLAHSPYSTPTRSTVTGSDGRYEVRDLLAEGYYLRFHDPLGRQPDWTTYSYYVSESKTLDVTLGADGFIRGYINDEHRNGLAGHVTLLRLAESGGVRTYETDSTLNGFYQFEYLPRGDEFVWLMYFEADDPSYAPQWWDHVSPYADPTPLYADDLGSGVSRDADLHPAATFTGTVSGQGFAVEAFSTDSVHIEVLVPGAAPGTWVGTGDFYPVEADGSYQITGIYPDSYRLRATYAGSGGVSRATSAAFTAGDGETVTTDLVIRESAYSRDLTGDGVGDVLARTSAGRLYAYPARGDGAFAPAKLLSSSWGSFTATLQPGDFNGDGFDDVIARDKSGYLWLYKGTGSALGSRVKIGSGWKSFTGLFSAGDFTGDSVPDVIARDSAGALYVYPGSGTGGFKGRIKMGTGWKSFTALFSPGDLDSDGLNDIVARDAAGYLWLYPGNGMGGTKSRVKIGSGWKSFTAVFSTGDFDGDWIADVIARDATGYLWLYPGDGDGHLGARVRIGSGWKTLTIAN